MHRYSYQGLIESDRNAEHYLYALSKVHDNSYAWGQMHILTAGYGSVKGVANGVGKITEAIFGSNISPYKGSPVTSGQMKAGHLGAQDGLFGIGDSHEKKDWHDDFFYYYIWHILYINISFFISLL